MGRNLFSTASPERIQSDARALKPYLAQGRWLGLTNRYTKNAANTLTKDLDPGPLSNLQKKHLRELTAASCPTHVVDGWSILGRAVAAALAGDQNTARHLAYYAELRAAASLLARSGIALLNSRHLVIQSDGGVEVFTGGSFVETKKGTHTAAWAFLHQWSRSPDAATLLAQTLEPAGVPLSSWFPETPAWARWNASASSWLRELGLEVRLMARDQYARNEASYRPTTIRHDLSAPAADKVSLFTNSLWNLLEPSGKPYASLDLYLLRSALERAYRAAHGVGASLTSAGYRSDIRTLVKAQGFSAARTIQTFDFLIRATSANDPELLSAALERSPASAPYHHLQAIARAAMLLRIATGAARRLFFDADIDSTLIDFWWQSIAKSRGLCDPTNTDDLMDSWADIDDAIAQIETWAPIDAASFVEFGWPLRGDAIRTLGKLELAGLIGLTA